MNWLEVSVTAEPQWQEIISDILMEQGTQGLEIVDPEAFRSVLENNRYLDYADDGFIESFGDKVVIRAYFQADRNIELLKKTLDEAFILSSIQPLPECEMRIRDDSEWKDNWKKHYKTFPISERVIIKPTWEEYTPENGQIVIELEPGMAFGTGTHETTRMCAVLLDDLIKGNERVLDLGCGTGILGIIAAKLGASHVLCVDIDDAACITAQENIRKNHVKDGIIVKQGELKDIPKGKYDIIVVNIIADVILALLPHLKDYCEKHTNILLSGIIGDRRNEVFDAAVKNGYRVSNELNEGEWVAMRLCIDF